MLNLNDLPDLPQAKFLKALLPRIWADETVVALWLGGSLVDGRGDAYSDVDLRVAVSPGALEAWRTVDLETLFNQPVLVNFLMPFSEATFLHHLILGSGEIYDLYIQATDQPLSKERRLIFACRDADFLAKLNIEESEVGLKYDPADAKTIATMLGHYWVILHKGQKVSYRGIRLLNWEGINLMRFVLLRLYYIKATGNDCGDLRRMSIHAWTPIALMLQDIYGDKIIRLVGLPTITKADIVLANNLLNQEVATVGRELAHTFGFPYPEDLEQMVLPSWTEFVAKEMSE